MPINVIIVSDSEVDSFVEDLESEGARVTKIREDGTWKLIAVRDDSEIEGQRDPRVNVSDEGTDTPQLVNNDSTLGVLSEKFESNGNPGAIGTDSTGGPSYGMYQIATKPGTMKRFLGFLEQSSRDFFKILNNAGGADGALRGSDTFKNAWRKLAKEDPVFADAQHAFIQATHYQPFVDRVAKDLALDVSRRSFALKNVTWSVAVQHGMSGKNIFSRALSEQQPAVMDDKTIINKVYSERSKVDIYFRSSTAAVKASVKKRFTREREDALELLKV